MCKKTELKSRWTVPLSAQLLVKLFLGNTQITWVILLLTVVGPFAEPCHNACHHLPFLGNGWEEV
jgi:hypothetical protein